MSSFFSRFFKKETTVKPVDLNPEDHVLILQRCSKFMDSELDIIAKSKQVSGVSRLYAEDLFETSVNFMTTNRFNDIVTENKETIVRLNLTYEYLYFVLGKDKINTLRSRVLDLSPDNKDIRGLLDVYGSLCLLPVIAYLANLKKMKQSL